MDEPLLTPPPEWAEQAATLAVDRIALSCFPGRLHLPGGRSLGDVERDLERGIWLVRDPPSGFFYRMGGMEFELRIRRQRAKDSGEWLAVVLNVDEARSVPPLAHRLRPKRVTISLIYDELACDLKDVVDRVARHRSVLANVGLDRFNRQAEVQSHGRLQAAVRSEYGELKSMIELLEQRPEDPEETLAGVLEGSERQGRDTLVLLRGAGNLDRFRNKRVRLTDAEGAAFNTRVRSVRDGRLGLAEPRGWTAKSGAPAAAALVQPFGMRQNAAALESFLAGDVEGPWEDLARLLCAPRELAVPSRFVPPEFFYCDRDASAPDLNGEQRRAVTGALASPHAFLIQGPPGTGKSEVICELVRQLTGRGERVLLLAPTHVAVDEVLARIGHKPGVWPLRVTWRDDLVGEKLRAYLPQNIGLEMAAQIIRPTAEDRIAHWQDERERVEARLALMAAVTEVVRRRDAVADDLRATVQKARAIEKRLAEREAVAEAEILDLRDRLRAAEMDLAHSEQALVKTVAAERDLRSREGVGLDGLREPAEALVQAAEHAAAVISAEQMAHASWLAQSKAPLKRLADDRATAEQAIGELRRAVWVSDREVARLRTELAEAATSRTAFGRFFDDVGLSGRARLKRLLAKADQVAEDNQNALAEWEHRHLWLMSEHDRLAAVDARQRLRLGEQATERERAVRALKRACASLATAAELLGVPRPGPFEKIWHEPWAQFGRQLMDGLSRMSSDGGPSTDLSAAWMSSIRQFTNSWQNQVLTELARRIRRFESVAAQVRRAVGARDEIAAEAADFNRRLRAAELWADAEMERLRAQLTAAQERVATLRADLQGLIKERTRLGADEPDPAAVAELRRRLHVLDALPGLSRRWRELTAEIPDDQLLEDVQRSLLRATNLVCATTKGIVGSGSQLVRFADYDTLIVDEASRVTESEFLIGAVKARRWVLVGDEHQLPPHVDQEDEHFLHALAALHRVERGVSPDLDAAVEQLGDLWAEDENQHAFRHDSVKDLATELSADGTWQRTFRERFAEAHGRMPVKKGADADRAFLQAMIRYLVESLFQRVVGRCPVELRQALVWQRRMVAPLARVVNGPIYGGSYRSPHPDDLARTGVTPLVTAQFSRPGVFVDTSRYRDAGETPTKRGFVNEREIELVTRVCEVYNAALTQPVTVSVLSFYKAQARRLEERLYARDLPMLDWQVIDVVDRIQGQQSDLVVISFTRARRGSVGERYGQWLRDVRRLNVACTRARRALVLVGHGDTLRRLGGHDEVSPARMFYDNLLELADSDDFLRLWKL